MTGGLHLRACDRLVGRRHSDSGILGSQQGHAERQQPAQGRYLGDLRAAVRRRTEVRQQPRLRQHAPERLAGEHVFHRVHRLAVHRDRGGRFAQREQPAGGRSGQVGRGNHARRGGERLLVRPNRLQAGHRGALRDGGFQHHAWTELRKPRSERVPHVPREAAR